MVEGGGVGEREITNILDIERAGKGERLWDYAVGLNSKVEQEVVEEHKGWTGFVLWHHVASSAHRQVGEIRLTLVQCHGLGVAADLASSVRRVVEPGTAGVGLLKKPK